LEHKKYKKNLKVEKSQVKKRTTKKPPCIATDEETTVFKVFRVFAVKPVVNPKTK